MTSVNGPEQPPDDRRPLRVWEGVAVAGEDGGFAYRPGEVLVRDSEARDFVLGLLRESGLEEPPFEEIVSGWWRFTEVPDPLTVIETARSSGFAAQPNHILFAHACGCEAAPCPPHPAFASQLAASPFMSTPFMSTPFMSTPFMSTPFMSTPFMATRPVDSTAIPTSTRRFPQRGLGTAAASARVVVLDTGLADKALGWLPNLLDTGSIGVPPPDPNAPTDHSDIPDGDNDYYLDPVAGHGTFIAGIVEQLTPGCTIDLRRVISRFGDGSEKEVVDAINKLVAQVIEEQATSADPKPLWERTILNLSFGGYVWEQAALLGEAVAKAQLAGIVVVASAGNAGSCRPIYPAALRDVVSVGALGPCGPAEFTNYGPWVRACAPGVDLVSSFFARFNGNKPAINGYDADDFDEWAIWSGTSFAAPVVAAALARDIMLTGGTAKDAVTRLIDAPHLCRIPCLGTVVNV